MPKTLVTRLIRVALAAALTLAFAGRAAAAPILLSNLQIHIAEDDELGLVANITAGVQAGLDDIFFDGYQVNLEENGEFIDPFAPPIVFIDAPFYALVSLLAGNSLPDDTLLFRIAGLTAGAMYSGSIGLFQFDGSFPSPTQHGFEFTASTDQPAPVPEPGTLILTGFGMAALLRKRLTTLALRRRQA